MSPTRSLVPRLLLEVLPHGGQHTARRNAWAAMSTDRARARARRDSSAALDAALARADRRTPAPDRPGRRVTQAL